MFLVSVRQQQHQQAKQEVGVMADLCTKQLYRLQDSPTVWHTVFTL